MPKQVRRTFTACWTCRRRRVRCDGSLPKCSTCESRMIPCDGYRVHLVWVDPRTGSYPPHSRRSLNPQATWADEIILDEFQLDHLVQTVETSKCKCRLHRTRQNPFNIIRATTRQSSLPPPVSPSLSLDSQISARPQGDCQPAENMLFHHYVHRVAWLMIPIDGNRNPWKSTYPSIALQDSSAATRSLYHAILAQSAFNLSNLHASDTNYSQESREHGLRHYGIALRELRESLERPAQNYNASVGAVITLAVIEGVYIAKKQRWRRHFDGASGLITQFLHDQPWTECSDSWVISQSLALSFEVAKTGSKTTDGYSPLTGDLLGAVAGQDFFGYTIGAYSKVIQSISAIRLLGEELSQGQVSEDLDARAARVLNDLLDNKDDTAHMSIEEVEDNSPAPSHQTDRRSNQEYREDRLYSLHFKIFRNAGLIYLYRTIFDAAPYIIGEFISAVLTDAMEFLELQGGSISIWPVFIAAVEACSEDDRAMVQRWIEFSCKLGIHNRLVARKIIQHVWETRDAEALRHGRDPSEIVVDWRDVQEQLGFDILLL